MSRSSHVIDVHVRLERKDTCIILFAVTCTGELLKEFTTTCIIHLLYYLTVCHNASHCSANQDTMLCIKCIPLLV